MASLYETSFFAKKRPWSRIKDDILRRYLPPYLNKVKELHRTILLVDAYAGRGRFGDGTKGSPLIICENAQRMIPGDYLAVFNNKRTRDHEALEINLSSYIERRCAIATRKDARSLLRTIADIIDDHTLFLYIDPMGLKGATFDLLRGLLCRVAEGHSTEILMRLDMSALHRHAGRDARHDPKDARQLQKRLQLIDAELGGEWWRDIEWNPLLSKDEREEAIVKEFERRLREHIQFAVSCPVREGEDKAIKYFITFCSRHTHGLALMNETMLRSYDDYMNSRFVDLNPLFRAVSENKEFYEWERQTQSRRAKLRSVIPGRLRCFPAGISRKDLWISIVSNHFLEFYEKDYNRMVRVLIEQGRIYAKDGLGGLNDNCKLYSQRPTHIPHMSL